MELASMQLTRASANSSVLTRRIRAVPEVDVTALLSAARKGRRSAVYEWLWAKYEEINPELSRYGVNWEALAAQFRKAGLTAGKGKQPTAKIVRETWVRVKREKASPKTPPLAPRYQRSTTLPTESTQSDPAPKFGFARPKGKPSAKE